MDASHPSTTPTQVQEISPLGINKAVCSTDTEETPCVLIQDATAVPTPKISPEDGQNPNINRLTLTAENYIEARTLDEKLSINSAAQAGLFKISTARKLLLLSVFTLAAFLDAFNNSALFPAIPIISEQLSFDAPETVWIVSAYQLTFAAFLLVVSHRVL